MQKLQEKIIKGVVLMRLVRTSHPQINDMVKKYELEEQPLRKVNEIINIIEAIIKTHTSYIIGNYLMVRQAPDFIRRTLLLGLKTPSLGTWQSIGRAIIDDLAITAVYDENEFESCMELVDKGQQKVLLECYVHKDGKYMRKNGLAGNKRGSLRKIGKRHNYEYSPKLAIPGFYDYYYDWDREKISSQRCNPINFRNQIYHGSAPSDEKCREYIETYEPLLQELLSSSFFSDTTVAVFKKLDKGLAVLDRNVTEGVDFLTEEMVKELYDNYQDIKEGHPYIITREGALVDVFPFMFNRKGNENTLDTSLFFFNDLIKWDDIKAVTYINYPISERILESGIKDEFLSVIDIDSWKEEFLNEFQFRVGYLTKVYKGRYELRRQIKTLVRSIDRGFLMVYGDMGIGKSALMAQLYKELTDKEIYDEDYNEETCTEDYYVVEYFINRGTGYDREEKFLVYLNDKLDRMFGSRVPLGDTVDEMRQGLITKLSMISNELDDKKLILIIDGLDESIGESSEFLQYLIRDVFKNIIVIYTSRNCYEIEMFVNRLLPLEYTHEFSMEKLNSEDVREILGEYIDEHLLSANNEIIDKITEKSEGNPLYIKLLCNKLEEEKTKLDSNSVNIMPGGISGLFDDFIDRCCRQERGNVILDCLYTFAAARDYLTENHLVLILNIGIGEAKAAVAVLKEVLRKGQEKGSYQLFHESLREYLKSNKANFQRLEQAIADYCERYAMDCSMGKASSPTVYEYACKYYSEHLVSLDNREVLYNLAENKDYINAQVKITRKYIYGLKLYKDAMQFAVAEKNEARLIELGIKACELYSSLDISLGEGRMSSLIIEDIMKNVEILPERARLAVYMSMAYRVLNDYLAEDEEKRAELKLILDYADRGLVNNPSIFNIYNEYPFFLLMKILIGIQQLGVNIEPLTQRGIITARFEALPTGQYLPTSEYGSGSRTIKGFRLSQILPKEVLELIRFSELSNGNEMEGNYAREKDNAESEVGAYISEKLDESVHLFNENLREQAMKILDIAAAKAYTVENPYEMLDMLEKIALEVIKQGDMDKGFSLLASVVGTEPKWVNLQNIAVKLAELDMLQESVFIADNATELVWLVSIYNDIMVVLIARKRLDRAREVLEMFSQVLQARDKYNSPYYISTSLGELAVAFAKEQDFENAYYYAGSINTNYLDNKEKYISSHTRIHMEYMKNVNEVEGYRRIKELLEDSINEADTSKRQSYLRVFAEVFAEYGLYRWALNCIEGTEVGGSKLEFIWHILIQMGNASEEEKEEFKRLYLETLESTLESNKGYEKLLNICDNLVVIDAYDKAVELMDKQFLKSKGKISHNNIWKEGQEHSEWDSVRSDYDNEDGRQSLNWYVSGYSEGDNKKDYLNRLFDAVNLKEDMDYFRDKAFKYIAIEWFRLGEEEKAFETIKHISYDEEKNNTLSAICLGLYQKSGKEKALELAWGIYDTGECAKALGVISKCLSEDGKHNESNKCFVDALKKIVVKERDTSVVYLLNELIEQVFDYDKLDAILQIMDRYGYDSSVMNKAYASILKSLHSVQKELPKILYKMLPRIVYNRELLVEYLAAYADYLKENSTLDKQTRDSRLEMIAQAIEI